MSGTISVAVLVLDHVCEELRLRPMLSPVEKLKLRCLEKNLEALKAQAFSESAQHPVKDSTQILAPQPRMVSDAVRLSGRGDRLISLVDYQLSR